MNYPFLYQKIHSFDVQELKNSIQYKDLTVPVWGDWVLKEVQSEIILDYIKKQTPHLKLFKETLYISQGVTSNFHIDRYHVHHLLHRVLVPLDDHFHYEWMQCERKLSYQPTAGEMLLFNNMIPHRFVSKSNQLREVIYFDLYDPLMTDILPTLNGNYSEQNALFDQKYKIIE